jgi:hypothetical protein
MVRRHSPLIYVKRIETRISPSTNQEGIIAPCHRECTLVSPTYRRSSLEKTRTSISNHRWLHPTTMREGGLLYSHESSQLVSMGEYSCTDQEGIVIERRYFSRLQSMTIHSWLVQEGIVETIVVVTIRENRCGYVISQSQQREMLLSWTCRISIRTSPSTNQKGIVLPLSPRDCYSSLPPIEHRSLEISRTSSRVWWYLHPTTRRRGDLLSSSD